MAGPYPKEGRENSDEKVCRDEKVKAQGDEGLCQGDRQGHGQTQALNGDRSELRGGGEGMAPTLQSPKLLKCMHDLLLVGMPRNRASSQCGQEAPEWGGLRARDP